MNRTLKFALAGAAIAAGVALVAAAQTPPVATPPAPPEAPATAPVAASPERFEPTDKVRADFDVSFPIDI